MSLKSQAISSQLHGPRKTKHLFCPPVESAAEYDCVPYFYVEARIDFADVRTGHHVTREYNDLMKMGCIDDDLLWTRDMVLPVDPSLLQASKPEGAKLGELPGFVNDEAFARLETQYIQYLLRHAEARVFRNFALNSYSLPGEGREEFQKRCMEILNESFRSELEGLREVANRRLEHLEQKHLKAGRPGEFESDRRMTQARSRFHETAETVAEMFLAAELSLEDVGNIKLHVPDPLHPDLEEALEALKAGVRRDICRLMRSYQERVGKIDEYIVHPGLKDLHLVRTCIVWLPAEGWRE
jgi:hypothetical protein